MERIRTKLTKDNITQILRHVIQIASFIVIPGLFALVWTSIGTIYTAIITGTATMATMLSPLLILAAVIPISVIWGRFFCSFLCSFGAMQELFNWIGKLLHIKKIKVPHTLDKYLKYIKYVVIILFFVLWTLQVNIDSYLPWSAFAILTSWNGLSGVLTIGGLLLLLIVIGSLFIDRFFCRYLCPLGGVFTLITRPRLFKIKKRNGCVGCDACNRSCPMNIDVNNKTEDKLKDGECIDCFKCVKACKPRALTTPTNEAVNGTIASLSILGLSLVGNVVTDSYTEFTSEDNTVVAVAEANPSSSQYKDGTYTGTGTGFRGNTEVSVVVEDGEITSIEVVSYQDDAQYFNKAKSQIISEIISSQGVDVSTVSGATFSSNGIIEAVANALSLEYTNNNSQMQSQGGSAGHGNGGRGRR